MDPIGKIIRALRQERGWSQEEVAVQLAISIPAYSKIETGITDINLSRLEQIAHLFGLPVTSLLMHAQKDDPDGRAQQLHLANDRLRVRDSELIRLQQKVILLFEELKLHKIK
jgi:transcriptional regulator with XRE-family HTH domain